MKLKIRFLENIKSSFGSENQSWFGSGSFELKSKPMIWQVPAQH
jgi:hypothetical protein